MAEKTGRRIGVYGGTFNPVHRGHIQAVTAFRRSLALDFVLVIPACVPPHKQGPEDIAPADRLAMTKIAMAGLPWCIVSDLEIRRGGASYTVDTLKQLRARYPGDRLYFLTGTDMFLTIDQWRCAEQIFKLCTVCTAPRHETDLPALRAHSAYLAHRYDAKTILIELEVCDIASTTIRARIAAGENVAAFVPDGVIAYIREHGLYERIAEEHHEHG